MNSLGGTVTAQNLQDELDSSVGPNKTTVAGTSKITVKFEDTQNVYKVENGKVEKKNSNPNVLEAYDLYENASTYIGLPVTNYSNTLPSELQNMEWQLLWAGPIDENDTNSRIYLISKNNIDYDVIPTVIKNNVEVEGAKPIAKSGNTSVGAFGKAKMTPSTETYINGIMGQYSGASNITNVELQNLNKKYFQYITENNKTGNEYNMKAVAYMMDTTTWGKFKTTKAEYAIGGASVELLLDAINALNKSNNGTLYETIVEEAPYYQGSSKINMGYRFRAVGEEEFKNTIEVGNNVISNGTEFWLASPTLGVLNDATICTNTGVCSYYQSSNKCYIYDYVLSSFLGFRPVVCLNSGTELEKVKDSNNNDVLKIVE